ncbi:MAG: hypothetical protein V3V29_05560 [Acidimicrobiia bacterium]
MLNHKSVIWKAEVMYELSDWGQPVAPSEFASRERLITQLPHGLVRVLRSRARAQGVSLNVLIDRLLHEALAMPSHHQQTVGAAFD